MSRSFWNSHFWFKCGWYATEPKTRKSYKRFLAKIAKHKPVFGDNTYIVHSYFQHHYFADSIYACLQADFTLDRALSPRNKTLQTKILHTPDSVFLHIRRGDFLESKHWQYKRLGSTYYNNAIDTIKSRITNPHIFIFSNDIAWCKTFFLNSLESGVRENMCFEFVEGNSETNAAEEMELMRSCKNAIIANSTFSWWAAYLINHTHKIVCMPNSWFYNHDTLPSNFLQCENWKIIDDVWRTKTSEEETK
ncbi:alpha-1,2-fucosyltransferase [uncultured Helicobacter sp.]|uniref:alpha-1,2-fucosyltransferase n=1 Tax=uncultured Helicobacter sp. TaxID=175537 RepID=UPI00374EC9BE